MQKRRPLIFLVGGLLPPIFPIVFYSGWLFETCLGWTAAPIVSATKLRSQSSRAALAHLARYTELEESTATLEKVQQLTRQAILNHKNPVGLQALKELGLLCQQRTAYDFSQNQSDPSIQYLPNILDSKRVASRVSDIVQNLVVQDRISTNPDSVDGLPSFHLNLISNGKSVQPTEDDVLKQALEEIRALIEPSLSWLVRTVQTHFDDPSLQVADVFLRKYGTVRQGISAHYDVFAKCTCVMALDDTARDGRNGLYTCSSQSSNHASLRRFFPLQRGDAVVHSWNVLHGVDVEPGLERTSLIVWFETREGGEVNNSVEASQSTGPDWLHGSDDISRFVRASSMESKDMKDSISPSSAGDSVSLYLQSAELGNAFALTRMGSLCEAKALSNIQYKTAESILNRLDHELQELVIPKGDEEDLSMRLAKRFWLEGALRGGPLAQMALADELMVEITSAREQDSKSHYNWMLPALLFGLVVQQGSQDAIEALQRVVELAVKDGSIQSEEDFESAPVVAIARVSTSVL